MQRSEIGFHKLKEENDSALIMKYGFKPSAPAKRHWLGEGIYFFIDPNGYNWSVKWPMRDFDQRTNSTKGIFRATLDLTESLDFTNEETRLAVTNLINTIKLKIKFELKTPPPITDGDIFASIFKYKMLEDISPLGFKAIIANFDDTYKNYRIEGSRVFLDMEKKMEVLEKTAQIQVCIIDSSTISGLTLI